MTPRQQHHQRGLPRRSKIQVKIWIEIRRAKYSRGLCHSAVAPIKAGNKSLRTK